MAALVQRFCFGFIELGFGITDIALVIVILVLGWLFWLLGLKVVEFVYQLSFQFYVILVIAAVPVIWSFFFFLTFLFFSLLL